MLVLQPCDGFDMVDDRRCNEDGLTRIFYQLREKTGVDFTFYKPSALMRRIERRLLVNQMDTLDYICYRLRQTERA